MLNRLSRMSPRSSVDNELTLFSRLFVEMLHLRGVILPPFWRLRDCLSVVVQSMIGGLYFTHFPAIKYIQIHVHKN